MVPKPFTVEHFRTWANSLVLDNDQAWVIEPFQARFLADVFAGYLENWLVIPEGNAKTTLLGGFVLYHALYRPNARVVVAASSRDQAEWLFQASQGFIERSNLGPRQSRTAHEARKEEPDTFRCYEGYREIRVNRSRIKVFAADDRTGDGANFTLAVLEELHRHRDLRLYRTWRGKAEKRGGQVVAISTAGEPGGEFEEVRAKMRTQATRTARRGAFLRATSETTVLHEYAVPGGRSVDDIREVKKANPLKAITPEQLKRKHDSPAMTPAHWRRFACGVPSELDSWVGADAWDALRVDVGGVGDGEDVYVAVRLGGGAGLAIVAPREDGRVAVKLEMLPAPTQGRIAYAGVEAACRRLAERYRVISFAYDPDQFRPSAERLIEEGLPMDEVPHRTTRLSRATATLWRLISSGLLAHDGDPVLREQVLAGRTKETLQGWHLEPTSATTGLIALAIAAEEATKMPPTAPEVIAL